MLEDGAYRSPSTAKRQGSLVRSLLANLHPLMGVTPLVMFFPGKFDGHVLQLFGRLKDNHYYRAFSLVP